MVLEPRQVVQEGSILFEEGERLRREVPKTGIGCKKAGTQPKLICLARSAETLRTASLNNAQRGWFEDDSANGQTVQAPTFAIGFQEPLLTKPCAGGSRGIQRATKEQAWGAFNSYVHSGLQAIVHHHVDVPTHYAIQTLQTSNGVTGLAALLMAMMTNDANAVTAVRDAQLAHLDCLPPLAR